VIYDARPFFATDVMFGALLLIAALSLLIEQGALRALERRTLERWGLARTLDV
jgi:ABC-type nitrate/sulfonate/bicarbonate transport system permease component